MMIQFPTEVWSEWELVASEAHAEDDLKKRIAREQHIEVEVEKLKINHEAKQLFNQELEADTTPALEMTTLSNYKTTPSAVPTDLIEGVLKSEGLCLVIGPSGSGKSTMAWSMLHSMMSGTPWLGQTVNQSVGAVGIVSYDMDANLVLDLMSGFPNIDPDKVSVVNAHKRGNPLALPQMRTQIAKAWLALGVEVMVVDSFSASFFGHDQNDAASTMEHYRMLLSFSRQCGAKSLIVIVHSTESNPLKIRGSSVHHDVADSILSVSGTQQDPRKLRMVKYRAAHGQYQMNPVITTKPDDVTHLIDLDYGAMALDGMTLPQGVSAQAFPPLPDSFDEAELAEDEAEDSDDLVNWGATR
jgi:KaiC/GvpD/RAD55 family RecA-like ATPase